MFKKSSVEWLNFRRGRGIANLFLTEAEASRGIILLTEDEEKLLFLGKIEAEDSSTLNSNFQTTIKGITIFSTYV